MVKNGVDIVTIILLLIAGVLIGFISPMVGIGGGLVNVPLLIFIFGVAPSSKATLISSVSVLLTSMSASLNYYQKGRLDIRSGLTFVVVAIPGGILGGYLAEEVVTNDETVKFLFAILIGFTALMNLARLFRAKQDISEVTKPLESPKYGFFRSKRKLIDSDGDIIEYEVNIGFGLLGIFFGGMLAGLLGVGGGIIYVPSLHVLAGLPFHFAASTSSFMIVFVVLSVLITRLTLFKGDIGEIFSFGLPLGIGAVLGARAGSTYAKRVQSLTLKRLFWFIALIAAIRMGYQPFVNLF